ncbi:18309_t:CDS:1, partial [Gigaspora margarita]
IRECNRMNSISVLSLKSTGSHQKLTGSKNNNVTEHLCHWNFKNFPLEGNYQHFHIII